jgi:hypothetical protein
MDMNDNENILIESFFKEAAQQQIEDNGFTERVMANLPAGEVNLAHRLTRLWTWFCVVLGGVLFFLFNGWDSLKTSINMLLSTILTGLDVFITTAPTTDLRLNPWLVLLAVAFVLIFLPYQTYRKLSATL